MVSPELSKPVDIVFKTVISLLLIADLVGNGLVILVILSSRPMKTPMNYLLINLALADIMVAIFMTPSFVMSDFTHPDGATGDLLCKTVTGSNLAWVGGFASVLSLIFIAVERYYAVIHPFSIQYKFTTKRIKILVLVGWIIAVIMELPEFIFETYQKDTVQMRRNLAKELARSLVRRCLAFPCRPLADSYNVRALLQNHPFTLA